MSNSKKSRPCRLARTVRSTSGQMMLVVLAAALVLGVSVTSMMGYLPQLAKQRATSRDYLDYSTLLGSAVEYMQYAISQRWTLNPSSGARDLETTHDLNTWATNDYNLERFLVSDLEISHPTYGLNVRLQRPLSDRKIVLGDASEWTMYIDALNLNPENPLYMLVHILKAGNRATGITYRIKRVNNVHYPQGGRGGIFLKIRAELTKQGASAILNVNENLFAESIVGYFPREVNSFALFIAGRLRLDQQTYGAQINDATHAAGDLTTAMKIGDVGIPALAGPKELDVTFPPVGLTFLSPVFVNGDLVLPPDPKDGGAKLWSPVTFADTLYIGDGMITYAKTIADLAMWKPQSAGGMNDTLFDQLTERVGGIRKGISRDGLRDQGLDVLFGLQQTGASASLMKDCIRYQNVLTDLGASSDSAFVMKQIQSPARTVANLNDGTGLKMTSGTYNYSLAMTAGNFFVPQGLVEAGITTPGGGNDTNIAKLAAKPEFLPDPKKNPTQPVIHVQLGFRPADSDGKPTGGFEINVEADMPLNGELSLRLKSDDPDKISKDYLEPAKKQLADLDYLRGQDVAALGLTDGDDPKVSYFKSKLDEARGKYLEALSKLYSPPDGGSGGESSGDSGPSKGSDAWSPSPEKLLALLEAEAHADPDWFGSGDDLYPNWDNGFSHPDGGGNDKHNTGGIACKEELSECGALKEASRAYGRAVHLDWMNGQRAARLASVKNAQIRYNYAFFKPKVTVKTIPYLINGNTQPDLFTLQIITENEESMRYMSLNGSSNSIVPHLHIGWSSNGYPMGAYEVGSTGAAGTVRTYWKDAFNTARCTGKPNECNSSFYKPGYFGYSDHKCTCLVSNNMHLNFSHDSSGIAIDTLDDGGFHTLNPDGDATTGFGDVPDGIKDMAATYAACSKGVKPTDWDYDMAPIAAVAWNFRPLDPYENPPKELVFDAGNATRQSVSPKWEVRSIVDTCRITADADFVLGFYVCKHLIIEPRQTPLRIIGTFAVGDANIHPSAVTKGIVWSSVFYHDAIAELRAAKVLGPRLKDENGLPAKDANGDAFDCNRIEKPELALNLPIWDPVPSLREVAVLYACMPTALIGNYPTPFRWTSFKPVCGPIGAQVSCTYRDENFTMVVMSSMNNLHSQ